MDLVRRSWRRGRAYSTAQLRSIVSEFPPVDFAMAYGSGVMRHGTADAMVDLIFGVRDPVAWHRDNIQGGHEHHYSLPARILGPDRIANFQKTAAGLHFNPLIQWDKNTVLKYGVIAIDDLCSDLQHWTTLYVSGRLHKPATILHAPVQVRELMRSNWRQALNAALLLLPPRFTDRDLFHTIAGLSYAGDIRMKLGFGENPRKVSNIVQANFADFKKLYGNMITEAQQSGYFHHNSSATSEEKGIEFISNLNQDSARSILAQLPERVRQLCFAELHPSCSTTQSSEPNAWTRANLSDARRALRHAIGRIGLEATVWQTLKGLYTAGISKSIAYAYRKSLKSMQR